jgi:parallel beta-helix repeat protein
MLQLRAPRRPVPLLIAWALVSAAGGPGPADTVHSEAPLVSKTVAAGDGPGIQRAIDDVSRQGGGIVHLPVGVYRIADGIRIRDDVALVGDGMDRTIIRWADRRQAEDFVKNSSTDGNRNIQVRDLTLDGEGRSSKDDSCCYGIRLRNVSDALIVNVAADGHSKDGFHLGYVLKGGEPHGVTSSRLTGCRARGNGRNGIALTHGDGNIIDNCDVSGNGQDERVAGIDVEPDRGNATNNNKIVGNRISGENVGLQLFVRFNGFARVANNAVCYNRLSDNGTGLYDFKGSKNIFVDNDTEDNNNPVTFHDANQRVGSEHASACQIPAVPPPPVVTPPTPTSTAVPTSTPTPAPPTSTPVPVSLPTPLLRP